MVDFVHLHVHSQYSILDGQASIKKMIDKAIADGMKGMALTDHGNMMGVKEFFDEISGRRGKAKRQIRRLSRRLMTELLRLPGTRHARLTKSRLICRNLSKRTNA